MNNKTHSAAPGSNQVSPIALALGAIGTACLAKGVSEFVKAGREEKSGTSSTNNPGSNVLPDPTFQTEKETGNVKYRVLMHMPEGDFYDEGIYNTEEEAEEAALYNLSSYRAGAEILENRGEEFGNPDEASYEIEEVEG